ncbi:MAG TPA: PDZ domain-containing protein [Ohtaekwangia sp.]
MNFILSIVFLYIVYQASFFFFSILLNVRAAHYFLGYNPKLFSFRIKGVQFSVGIYIPVIGLGRIYTVVDGKKHRMQYPWEFFDRSRIVRLIVTYGGTLALLITGLLIFIGVYYAEKDIFISKVEMNRHGIYPSAKAREWGFQSGDQILYINGKDFERYENLFTPAILIDTSTYFTVLRNGQELIIKPPVITKYLEPKPDPFITINAPFEINKVMSGSPAASAGIIPGDRILKVNDRPVVCLAEVRELLREDDDGKVVLEIQRTTGTQINILSVQVLLDAERKAGFTSHELADRTTKTTTLGEAVQKGSSSAFQFITINIRALFKITSGKLESSKKLGSPIGIMSLSELSFWNTSGMCALWYTVWNFLPLPKSAFWELTTLGYEVLTRKRYVYSWFANTISWSWLPLILLMALQLISDLTRLFDL